MIKYTLDKGKIIWWTFNVLRLFCNLNDVYVKVHIPFLGWLQIVQTLTKFVMILYLFEKKTLFFL